MAKKKYYAVRVGKAPGIYRSWFGDNGAEQQVKGFRGAEYKGFTRFEDAQAFMDADSPKKTRVKKKENSRRKKPVGQPSKTPTRGRWWLEPGYDRRLEGGRWNPKYD